MNTSSRSQRLGLVLAGLLSLTNAPSALTPTPDGETGPPYVILLLGTVLGLIGLIAVVPAWRGNRVAMRVLAGTLVINVISSLPAFFVDVPAWLKLAVAIACLLSIAAIVLMFRPAPRSAVVVDQTVAG